MKDESIYSYSLEALDRTGVLGELSKLIHFSLHLKDQRVTMASGS